MNDIKEKMERQALSEGLISLLLAKEIINLEESSLLQEKLALRNGLSNKSMIVKNVLINNEIDASIQTQKDTK